MGDRVKHMVRMVNEAGDVSALCFDSPRAIDMKVESWVNHDASVTCRACLRAILDRYAATGAKRYFGVDDGGNDYTIVAVSVEHAKAILRAYGVEFTKEDGDSAPIDDPAFANLDWYELSPAAVAKLQRCHTDDGRGVIPLTECQLGDFFCSEW